MLIQTEWIETEDQQKESEDIHLYAQEHLVDFLCGFSINIPAQRRRFQGKGQRSNFPLAAAPGREGTRQVHAAVGAVFISVS